MTNCGRQRRHRRIAGSRSGTARIDARMRITAALLDKVVILIQHRLALLLLGGRHVY